MASITGNFPYPLSTSSDNPPGCWDLFSRCLDKIKNVVCTFFRWLCCCHQNAPKPLSIVQLDDSTTSARILNKIKQDPEKGEGVIRQLNTDVREIYTTQFSDKSAFVLLGHVNWVPGEYGLWMGGIALIIAHLKKKYGFNHFYACQTLEGFSKKLAAFVKTPHAERGVFIVPSFSSAPLAQGFSPNFPQHKIAVLVEKSAAGQIKLAILNPQATEQVCVVPEKIEGCREIWEGWQEQERFNVQELILRAVVRADLPKDTQLLYSTVERERRYGCTHFAIQDGMAFLRDPDFFDKMVLEPTGQQINGMTVQRIIQLPSALMIGTQSLKQLTAYLQANQGINHVVKSKGGQEKTLSDYLKKYTVNGRNHFITVKVCRYYEIVLGMLTQMSKKEIDKSLSATLIQ